MMKKWRIRRNSDWAVAAFLLILLSYPVVSRFRQPINEWLMNHSPEKLSTFNQPEHQGVYAVTLLLAAALFSLLWIWQRRSQGKSVKKVLMLVWAGTGVLLMGVAVSYHLECRQIVRTPYDTDLVPDISVTAWEDEESYDMELTAEEKETLLSLCLNPQIFSAEEQAKLSEEPEDHWEYDIMIRYPKYKNHSYSLWFCLQDGVLGLRRGHSEREKIYYDGRAIKELLEK